MEERKFVISQTLCETIARAYDKNPQDLREVLDFKFYEFLDISLRTMAKKYKSQIMMFHEEEERFFGVFADSFYAGFDPKRKLNRMELLRALSEDVLSWLRRGFSQISVNKDGWEFRICMNRHITTVYVLRSSPPIDSKTEPSWVGC